MAPRRAVIVGAGIGGLAAAVELVHAYSLVHDDLPAMDDDDIRRGRPTTHRAFDEATVFRAGAAYEAATAWRDRRPEISQAVLAAAAQ